MVCVGIAVLFVLSSVDSTSNIPSDNGIKMDVNHEKSLIWAQVAQGPGGLARLVSVAGEPQTWVINRTAVTRYITAPNPKWRFKALSHDYNRHFLYWAEMDRHKIQRIELGRRGRLPQDVYSGTSGDVTGLTVDWLSGNVYWCDTHYKWIAMTSVTAIKINQMKLVVTSELDQPMAVVVHPQLRFLFWCDSGQKPRLERSDLVGGHRKVLITSGIWKPISLWLDNEENRLYWLDALLNQVSSADLNGYNRDLILELDKASYKGLTLSNHYIFITAKSQLDIYDRETLSKAVSFDSASADLGSILMYTEYEEASTDVCNGLGCSELCISEVGCACSEGKRLLGDGISCTEDEEFHSPQVIYSTGGALCRFPANLAHMAIVDKDMQSQCFLSNRQGIVAVAIDSRRRVLYFSEQKTKSISALKLNGSKEPDIIVGGTGSVQGLTVDWLAENVYWTDSAKDHIGVCRTDGRFQKVLIRGLTNPRGIAVDPVNRQLFWSESGNPATISKSSLGGSRIEVIVMERISSPFQLAIDYKTSRLYWSDPLESHVGWVDLEGGPSSIAFEQPNTAIYGVAIYQDFLFWTARGKNNGIHVAFKETGRKIRGVVHPGETSDIVMLDTEAQPQVGNHCTGANSCSQLCFSGNQEEQCGCAFGFVSEGRFCKRADSWTNNFVLFTDTYHKQVYQLHLPSLKVAALSVQGANNPIAVDYDPREQVAYWTDVGSSTIQRLHLNSSKEELVIDLGEDSTPDGIALDIHSRLLFYTDTGKKVIGVTSLEGSYHATLITKGLDQPRAIAADPGHGYIYWSDWGLQSSIKRAEMDGSGQQVVVNTGIGHWPNGLTLDANGQVLYWCDARADSINSVDLVLLRTTLVYQRKGSHFFGITHLGNDLFFSDWTKSTVMKLRRTDAGYQSEPAGPSSFARINAMHAYSSHNIDRKVPRYCGAINPCSQICLPVPSGYTCACSDQYFLLDDEVTCQIKQGFAPISPLSRNPFQGTYTTRTTSSTPSPTAAAIPKRSPTAKPPTSATKNVAYVSRRTPHYEIRQASTTLSVPHWIFKYQASPDQQRNKPYPRDNMQVTDSIVAEKSASQEFTTMTPKSSTPKPDRLKGHTIKEDEWTVTPATVNTERVQSDNGGTSSTVTEWSNSGIDDEVRIPTENKSDVESGNNTMTTRISSEMVTDDLEKDNTSNKMGTSRSEIDYTRLSDELETYSHEIDSDMNNEDVTQFPSTSLYNSTNGSIYSFNESRTLSSTPDSAGPLSYLALGAVLATGLFLMIFIVVMAAFIYKKCVKKRLCLSTSSQGLTASINQVSTASTFCPQTVVNYENYSIPLQQTPHHEIHYHDELSYVNDICNHSEFDSDFDDDVTEIDYTGNGDVIDYGEVNKSFVKADKNSMGAHERNGDPTFMTFLQAHKQAVN